MLTLRYHLKPLEYMLQHEFFEESSKEGMISIISVLTERQDSKVDNPQDTSRNSEVRPAVLNIILFVKNWATEEKQTSQAQRKEESDVEMTSESDTSGDQSDRTV